MQCSLSRTLLALLVQFHFNLSVIFSTIMNVETLIIRQLFNKTAICQFTTVFRAISLQA